MSNQKKRKLSSVLLALFLLAFIGVINSNDDTSTRTSTTLKAATVTQTATELAEIKLDQYISKFGLSNACKKVIMAYMPDFEKFSHMEADAMQSYSIFLTNGTEYLLAVSKENEPLCLQSSEKDYNSRTRYYDAFAK